MNWLLIRPTPPFYGISMVQTPEETFIRSRETIRRANDTYQVLIDTDTMLAYLFLDPGYRDAVIFYVREDIVE